jgi:hypothetical protein
MDILSAVLVGVLSAGIFLIGVGCCLFIAAAIVNMVLLDD